MKSINGITDAANGINKKINALFGEGEEEGKQLLKTNKFIYDIYDQGTEKDENDKNPLLSFQYFVNIKYNGNLRDYVYSAMGSDFAVADNNSFIKSVKLPDVKIDTNTMNEYNRKRLNHQKVEFSPVTITFHDIVNGNTKKLWQLYYQYYFSDGRFGKSESIKREQINPEQFEFGNYGYNTDLIGDNKHLLREIDIYQISAKMYNKVTLYNPRIVEYATDDLASDSSEVVEVRYTLEYEWATFNTVGFSDSEVEDSGGPLVKNDPVLTEYFEQGKAFDFAEWQEPDAVPYKRKSFSQMLKEARAESERVRAELEAASTAIKNIGRNIASRADQLKSFVGRIETDILGRSEPRIKIPGSREILPVIDKVPSNHTDVVRNLRRNRGNTPFSGADNDGQIQWPTKPNPTTRDRGEGGG